MKHIDLEKKWQDYCLTRCGDEIENYIIEKYQRCGNKWVLDETFSTYTSFYFVINKRLYFDCNGKLFENNTDFNNIGCQYCYKICGRDHRKPKHLIREEYVCESMYLNFRLHRKVYEDGTMMYTLRNFDGECVTFEFTEDVQVFIDMLKKMIKTDMAYADRNVRMKFAVIQERKFAKEIAKYKKDGTNHE